MDLNIFTDNAKVMAKGKITIPKDIRSVLGVSNGDRVTFIVILKKPAKSIVCGLFLLL